MLLCQMKTRAADIDNCVLWTEIIGIKSGHLVPSKSLANKGRKLALSYAVSTDIDFGFACSQSVGFRGHAFLQ